MKEEKPYAQYYDQGHAAGFTGARAEACPHQVVGADRREQLTRRLAWLEGRSDGEGARGKMLEAGRIDRGPKRRKQLVPPASRPHVRSVVQRRYQRGAMRAAGGPERYVDRRLRQLAEEDDAQRVTASENNS
jgi:ribosome modulation factor